MIKSFKILWQKDSFERDFITWLLILKEYRQPTGLNWGCCLNIKGLELEELQAFLGTYHLPKYRAAQIFDWLYQKGAADWEEISVLPKSLREKFRAEGVSLGRLETVAVENDPDGTRKYLFQLEDGRRVESVYLPDAERHTVCFSTQVGCAVGCLFCATGQLGWSRNLTAAEIIEQPLRIGRDAGVRINSLVAMGQGEPLLNVENLLKAVRIMNHPQGMGIGARHITISTCGIVPGIQRLAEEPLQLNLAISLHAADDRLRDRLMPINRKYPLAAVLEACHAYLQKTNRRITFEYTMIAGVNDRPEDLRNLAGLLSGLLCHINLIPFNPIPGKDWRRSDPARVRLFEKELLLAGIETTVRKERGTRLSAACGQLQGKYQNEHSSPVS
ncbi:23S rRNA m(2)A-2503 methyltransferase [Hydrogenispora ethanolica]|uniref:Probable dual-specificity RNA methyltransferase RlmN n=1 Tax=Hydrogenispora ethanolica TaxID=1082276 RepID=A0A4R1R956_HYDET|nr:23S rRNA m(2)A-2503 methyltransferase [Hydrogenispora ethanolica]